MLQHVATDPFPFTFFLLFLVTRIQFYAIEIARNKRGLNKCHYKDKSAAEQDSEGTNQEKTCENSEVTDQERTGEQTEPSETEHNTES